jgi:hypothetical protein
MAIYSTEGLIALRVDKPRVREVPMARTAAMEIAMAVTVINKSRPPQK